MPDGEPVWTLADVYDINEGMIRRAENERLAREKAEADAEANRGRR